MATKRSFEDEDRIHPNEMRMVSNQERRIQSMLEISRFYVT